MKVCAAAFLTLACSLCCLAQSPNIPVTVPALRHIDVMQVDMSVDPCENFYQHVCAKLNAENPIPPDKPTWGPFDELELRNRQVLLRILEQNKTPNSSRTPNQQKIGDFYASCMNQASNHTSELFQIQLLMDSIDRMRDKHDIAAILARIHSSFGQVWNVDTNQTNVALFGFAPQPDYNDAERVVAALDQGGLGMPGRDFYLKTDDESKAIRDKYLTLIRTILALRGESEQEAVKHAITVVRVETMLAQAQIDNIARRDPHNLNNRFTLSQLKMLTPAFDWDGYLKGIGAPTVPIYEVYAPGFLRLVNKMIETEDLSTWKTYLRWQLLLAAARSLGNSWRDASFAFESVLQGLKEQQPDSRRCVAATDRYLGDALGQAFVAEEFPPENKARVQKLLRDIEAAMDRDFDAVPWMQPETRHQAHLKLAAVINKIGYPDKWIDYTTLKIAPDGYAANVQRATSFELKRQLAFIGHPMDRTQWWLTAATVDGSEDPQTNTISFPAGILQPVIFDAGQDDPINYGAAGHVAGHEMTHGFDDEGRKFDLKGNLNDWWTPQDAKEYEERGACIAKEYTGPVPGVTGVEQNGKLTQGEDTADNGGLYLALSALSEDLKQQGKTLDDKNEQGLTNLQRFFIAFASINCGQFRPESMRTHVLTDPHSLPWVRVNNVVSNMPEFQKAFGCKSGQPMVHATQCRVW